MNEYSTSASFTGEGFQASGQDTGQWSMSEGNIQQHIPAPAQTQAFSSIDLEYHGHTLTQQQKVKMIGIKDREGNPWLYPGRYATNIEVANLFRVTPHEDWDNMIEFLIHGAINVGIFPWNLPANDKYIHISELKMASRGRKVVGVLWDGKCRNCKKKEVRYVVAQTRSPDEPGTEFYNCYACGYRWTQSC